MEETFVIFSESETHHKHSEVRCMARHPEDCRLEVPFMAREIDEGDYFCGVLADLNPVQLSVIRFVHNLSSAVEAQDVIAHRARPSRLHLVLVPEEFLARLASSIVQFAVRQHAEQRRFSRIYIAHHRHSDLHKVFAVNSSSD